MRPDEYEGDIDDLEDAALLIDDKHILNLAEVVRQDIWLAMPMFPGCNWSGAGECPNLQARLHELDDVRLLRPGEDDIEKKAVDPRWEALLKLQESSKKRV